MSRLVIALGGNALLPPDGEQDANALERVIEQAALQVAQIAGTRPVVLTHGNGPQIGLLASQSIAGLTSGQNDTLPVTLDVLGAESEGMIGYLLNRHLTNLMDRQVATLLTQVVVDRHDPAFVDPQKPVGPLFDRENAALMEARLGWSMRPVSGGFRRVVPSPVPLDVIDMEAIRILLDSGRVVICAGGGGIPVTVDENGILQGIDAVVDKDLSAALLADRLGADELLILTNIDAVYSDWGTTDARAIRHATPDSLGTLAFEAGTMHPKIAAACQFATEGGTAHIGALADAAAVLDGTRGTTVSQGVEVLDWYPATG